VCVVGLGEELSLQKKSGYKRWVARNWYAADSMKNVKINSDKKHAIFA